MPEEIRAKLGPGFEDLRRVYLESRVTEDYRLAWRSPDAPSPGFGSPAIGSPCFVATA